MEEQQLSEQSTAVKLLHFVQWAASVVCIAQGAARASNDIRGAAGGLMLICAAWVISPVVSGMKLMRKKPFFVKALIQVSLAAALFAGGLYISSFSEGNIVSEADLAEASSAAQEEAQVNSE